MSRSMPSPAESARAWLERPWLRHPWLQRAWSLAARTARLAVGQPDYPAYVAHLQRHHPDLVPLTREAFFRERLTARYGRGSSRCC